MTNIANYPDKNVAIVIAKTQNLPDKSGEGRQDMCWGT